MAINLELEKMYHEDKKERENISDDPEFLKLLDEHDTKRITRLREMLPTLDTNEIWNCHYAALIFQHGTTPEDYKQAHEFAKKAVDMGSNVTKWLYAATLDRYLVSIGKKQKFGTQFIEKNGQWERCPVDGTISDKQREEYYVPPLSQALEVFKKKYTK